MIQKTNMTIDAYLRNVGLKSVSTASHNAFIPLKSQQNPSFSDDLTTEISSNRPEAIERKTGLTLSDYIDRATTRASTRFFNNSTIRNGLPQTGSLNRLSSAFAVPEEMTTISDSVAHGSPTETGAGTISRTDGRALITDSINKAARKYNLPAKLIESVIQAESNFQVNAVSPAGARGLMQLMPGTAEELGVDDPFDVRQNIDGGTGYLRQMMDRFGGDVKLALAAYNAGPGTVEKYNGNVPYRETQKYIQRVLKGVSA